MAIELKVGDLAPDFRAQAIGGKYGAGQEVSLADFRGSAVVLYFYPKDDTPGCTVQACGLRDAWGELSAHANIFGVSVDSGASHEKFIKKYQLPFPLLSDPDKKIVEFLRRLGGEKHVWEKIHGRRAQHLCHRWRRADFGDLPQGEAGRARRDSCERRCATATG